MPARTSRFFSSSNTSSSLKKRQKAESSKANQQKKNTNSSTAAASSSNNKKQTSNNRKKKKKNSSDEESSSSSDSEEDNKKKKKKSKKTIKKKQLTEKDKEKMNKLWERFVTGKPRLLIGCHVAFGSQGIEHAPLAAVANGCCGAFALFLGNQKTYSQKEYTDKQVSKFIENCKDLNFDREYLLPHASYLINLANPDKEKLAKSKNLFLTEYKKCQQLGLKRYNFHPGSTVGETTVENGCKQIAECINWANSQVDNVISVWNALREVETQLDINLNN
ncbi:hypothetical protein C9374_004523 [Naegleria lovaniensis]|uniref:Xylose isomerase-like TIM barrel domain-containing protein n=1 Tax=Naegleria lovaniensis TaxID=51637 RepID=A0AA88GQ19_NAELO|nr:uncharacterized protein C9374_004523 [Naegleria lovaniensis]KAG2383186.1 hypothetical protein C9374_004523 [Naegleria lovaniensis]